MLLYEYISPGVINLDMLDYIEIILWFISILVLAIIGIKFFLDVKKGVLNKTFNWVGAFFLWFIAGRICRLIAKFVIGYEYGYFAFKDTLLLLAIVYTITTYTGLFCIGFFFERNILKKTHYIYSCLVIAATILSIINYQIDVMIILTPIYVVVLLGIPIVFLNLARKMSGNLRTKAIMVAIGVIIFVLGIAFDVPEAASIWIGIPGFQDFAKIGSPIFQIIGILLLNYGFPREISK